MQRSKILLYVITYETLSDLNLYRKCYK